MSEINPYEVLGIPKDADEAAIKSAYRKLSKKYHPDLHPNDKEAEAKFKEINEANTILTDPEKKKMFDTYGTLKPQPQMPNMGAPGFGFPNMEDIMNMMGHGRRQQTKMTKGTDIRININLTLEEIFSGIKKNLKYNRNAPCIKCKGEGGDYSVCSNCHGQGMTTETVQTMQGIFQTSRLCDLCHGQGKTLTKPCDTCHGTGFTSESTTFETIIPPGVNNGDTLVAEGHGNFGKSGQAGNLHILIAELPHNTFKRDGANLIQTVNFDYPDLVLGCKIDVDTIEGTKVKITIPAYSETGSIFRVQGKGLCLNHTETVRGDMLIIADLRMPGSVTDEEKELLKKLKKLMAKDESL